LAIVDLGDATAKPLMAAPAAPQRPYVAWSPDSRAVAVGRTFAPLTNRVDHAGAQGLAFMTIEVGSGTARRIPVEDADARRIVAMQWINAEQMELVTRSGESLYFRMVKDRWRAQSAAS